MRYQYSIVIIAGVAAALLPCCKDDPDDEIPESKDTATEVDGGDTPIDITDITAEVSDVVRTVVTVRFTTDIPTRARIAFGPSEEMSLETPLSKEAATEHEQLLLGLPSNKTVYYRIAVEADGVEVESAVQTVKTGGLPTVLPPMRQEGDGFDGFIIVPLIGSTTAVTVIDPKGNFVWYSVEDRELDTFRVRLSVDGKGIVYNAATVSGDPSEASELVRISFDGHDKEVIPVPLLAHDFVEHPDGTLAAIVAEFREFDGEAIRGEKILEIAPDGTETEIWTAWDCFDPETDLGEATDGDWTFANALDYDPENEVYYIGMRNFSSIAKVPRDGGGCEWVLGNTGETIDFAPGTQPFLNQHQFQVLDDTVLVFDNNGLPGLASRVVEYRLDLEANEATEIWSYAPGIYTYVLGEPIRLENGDTFVNWSSAGRMERITPSGETTWQLDSGAGNTFGFNTLSTSLYLD